MMTINGFYFDGQKPIAIPAQLALGNIEAVLTAGDISVHFSLNEVIISPRIGVDDRFINLPNGAQFSCTDHPFFDSLPQESPTEGPVAWLEERWGIALACVVIVTCLLLMGYFFGLPVAAEHIAAYIPIQTEQAIGRQALASLDKQKWFSPTTIDVDQQKIIKNGFDNLISDLPFRQYYRLEFRSSKQLGANALALPGGIIVLTDDMVKTAENNEEILAILAHEIGHVELRHTLRSILQNSIVAATTLAVTSDAASLSAAVAGLPAMLAQTKYSRKFESDADNYCFRLLKQKGYSPLSFAAIMERLAKKEKRTIGAFAYVSTHPLTTERIDRARLAAEQ
jgi:predicted Zn-dependent protease